MLSFCFVHQDSGSRDMKSAQNTPSRQPMVPPHNMAPPTLQENRQAVLGGGDFKKVNYRNHNSWRLKRTVIIILSGNPLKNVNA